MIKGLKLISVALTLFVLVSINSTFALAGEDSPEKVVRNFTDAYFMLDQSMADYLSKDCLLNEDGKNVVDLYLENKAREAKTHGYQLSFLQMKPVAIQIKVLSQKESSAKILCTADIVRSINPFYRIMGSIFGLLNKYKAQGFITVVKENENWRIDPGSFDLPIYRIVQM